MLVSNIFWETDGQEIDLPNKVEVKDGLDDDAIVDYLYDTYGYLVIEFVVPMTDDDVDYFGEYVNEIEAKVS